MGKAKAAQVRAVATFCVGVRTIHAGEVLAADDPAVVDVPAMFEPVLVGERGEELFVPAEPGMIIASGKAG